MIVIADGRECRDGRAIREIILPLAVDYDVQRRADLMGISFSRFIELALADFLPERVRHFNPVFTVLKQ